MALEELYQLLTNTGGRISLNSVVWATGHGLNAELIQRLGQYAHVIHPDFSSNPTPFSGDPTQALEGSVNYGKALMGYRIQGDGHDAANGVLSNGVRPVVMVLNTTGLKLSSSTSAKTISGSHWVTCVGIPPNYTTPRGQALRNHYPRIFFIDSLNENSRIPAVLRNVLTNGARVRTVSGSIHIVPPAYPNAEMFNILDVPQQLGGSDCGFWACYNAIMLVLTGMKDFTQGFKRRERGFASKLRTIFTSLTQEAPIGGDEHGSGESTLSEEETLTTSFTLPSSGFSFKFSPLAKLEFKPGQPVYFFGKKGRLPGFINTASSQGFRVRLPHLDRFPNLVVLAQAKQLLPRVEEDAVPRGPQIAVPGVRHLGPSKPVEGQPVINRNISEVEIVDGKPYIRIYMTIPRPANFKSIDLEARTATSDYKDVQQQPKTGRLIVSTGANRGLWVGAGRPLRAAKWAQKYIAEHHGKADKSTKQAKKLQEMADNITGARGLEYHKRDIERLRRKKTLNLKETERLNLREHQLNKKLKQDMQMKARRVELRKKAQDARIDARVWRNPHVRSFLCDLKVFESLVANAIPEELAKKHPDSVAFNVDRHYEPNQYNLEGDGLRRVLAALLDRSLITHVYYPDAVDVTTSGEIRDIRELWYRLGIPEQQLDVTVWTEGTGFADRKKFGGVADNLSMFYGTWLESLVPEKKRKPSLFVSKRKAQIPFFRRREMLTDFLDKYGISGPEETRRFMEDVVGPWASQAEIARIMAEDYDRMNQDENIKKTPSVTNFAKKREEEPFNRMQLIKLGNTVEHMLGDQCGAVHSRIRQVLDRIIQVRPELRDRYAKISAVGQDYTFYQHAQMVLGQYLVVIATDNEDPLIPRSLFIKAILFHDMEKVNSKRQYGKEGEHVLTVEEMKRYRYLFGADQKVCNHAVRIVDGDPFGDYFKGKIDARQAFFQITWTARGLGFGSPGQWRRFFIEYHQFYQADFTSYTSASCYYDEDGMRHRGQPIFNKFLTMVGNKKIRTQGPRFIYTGAYEKKYQQLDQLFRDRNKMLELALELAREQLKKRLEWHAQKLTDTYPARSKR
ncbi:MAG: hypothetical protein JRE64_04625 [Deltaproteobacteria bacterium]|nr:hypothetical protein [Deltaproteobacteria bacterium]